MFLFYTLAINIINQYNIYYYTFCRKNLFHSQLFPVDTR